MEHPRVIFLTSFELVVSDLTLRMEYEFRYVRIGSNRRRQYVEHSTSSVKF